MSASLGLGLIGGFLFGPAGYLVGSLIGSLLDPAKQEGPRLQSLKLQVSQYGDMVKDVWGTDRIAGNVIWIGNGGNLVEHKHESGGKGGPQVTTYTYTASFAVGLCNRVGTRNSAILGILRIWADSRLIWGKGVSDDSAIPITIYLGTETQGADPTMEADLGAQNVPGYRGTAYVVFTDWDLSQFFNRIPNLEFEVYTSAGGIPIRISTWDTTTLSGSGNVAGVSYDATTGLISIANYPDLHNYHLRQYTLQGAPAGTSVDASLPAGLTTKYCVVANLDAAFYDSSGGPGWYVGGALVTSVVGGPWPTPAGVTGFYQNGFIFTPAAGLGSGDGIERWPATDGIPAASPDASVVIPGSAGDFSIEGSDDGHIYVFVNQGAGTVYEFNEDLTSTGNGPWSCGLAGGATNLPTHIGSVTAGSFFKYNGFWIATTIIQPSGVTRMYLWDVGPTDATQHPQIDPFFWGGNNTVRLGSTGYFLGKDGVALLDPPVQAVTLAEIVTDVSGECGLNASQIDVTELTDLVDGFVISSQMTGRNRLEPTRNAYFYDAVESDGKVKFPKRGRASIVTIPDDELAAFVTGTTPPPQLANERAQEFDLPQQLTVEYINKDADYQTGSQIAQRQVTQSQSKVSLQLPIVMDDAKGLTIANVILDSAWAEREKYTITFSRKYAYLDPCDVITTRGRDIRLLTREETGTTTIKFEAVQELAAVYTQASIGIPATGMPPQTPPAANATTDLLLLDLPLITDSDTPGSGFYSAMGPDGGGPWPGATLMRSIDGGVSYSSLLVDKRADTIGTTSDALGLWDPDNNILDTVNTVTVVLTAGGTLSGVTLDAMLNGANMAAIGDEVLQFMTPTLIAPNTYTLTGLLRGRRGTEYAIANHAIGDAFVLLPVDRADTPLSDLFLERSYKGVTAGQTVASAAAQLFTNTGNGLRPYSPVQLGGGVDASGNVTMTWTRRTRIGGAWMPFVDVPLSEPSEQYVVQIWDSAYALVAASAVVSSQTMTLSAADQVALFGAVQQTIFFTVNQLGIANIGTQARGSIAGAGSSNDPPLNPIPPYGS